MKGAEPEKEEGPIETEKFERWLKRNVAGGTTAEDFR
jgi:hypothetical protein